MEGGRPRPPTGTWRRERPARADPSRAQLGKSQKGRRQAARSVCGDDGFCGSPQLAPKTGVRTGGNCLHPATRDAPVLTTWQTIARAD